MDFNKRGFKLIGIFDKDPQICGTVISELPVMPIEKLESFCEKNNPVCAILCIPKTAAEKLIQRLTDCGIKAFWNFSHYDIRAVDGIVVENVHLSDSLKTLAYGLNNPPEK